MDIFVEQVTDLKLRIYEACEKGLINESEFITLFECLDEKLDVYSESLKDVGRGIKTVVKNPKSEESKKILTGLADKYNASINKRATSVAKKIVKDPTKGGKVQVSPEVYDKYQKDMLKWRTRYKVSEILLTGLIAIGPVDTVIKAATITGMARSNDPVDKKTVELLNKVKEKAASLKNRITGLTKKVKNKELSEQQLSSEISAIDTATKALAKQTDVAIAKKETAKLAMANESVYEKMDKFLMENNCMTDEGYDILNMLIERTDFSQIDMFSVVCHYTGI